MSEERNYAALCTPQEWGRYMDALQQRAKKAEAERDHWKEIADRIDARNDVVEAENIELEADRDRFREALEKILNCWGKPYSQIRNIAWEALDKEKEEKPK